LLALATATLHTGRRRVLVFDGGYHGSVLSFHGGTADPLTVPHEFVVGTYNDAAGAGRLIAEHGSELAAVLVEPVLGAGGCIPGEPDFLAALRHGTAGHGALLIFDEVMTGFRVAPGGAQELFGIRPDLTTLGKVIGGGLPVAAYGGRADLLSRVAPSGPVYQAGTLSGNPLAMAAGLATLTALTPALHARIAARTTTLVEGLREIAARRGVPMTAGSAGSMWGFFFHPGPVRDFAAARASDVALFRRFFHAALRLGVYLAPSAFEAGFLSAAHDDAVIADALQRLDDALEAALG
jgi:glutamate-1-semialdehyde 2,1-aminomutase